MTQDLRAAAQAVVDWYDDIDTEDQTLPSPLLFDLSAALAEPAARPVAVGFLTAESIRHLRGTISNDWEAVWAKPEKDATVPIYAAPQPSTANESAVRDLLAVIHRDGGHYTAEHGLAKSLQDAEARVCADRASIEPQQRIAEPLSEERIDAGLDKRFLTGAEVQAFGAGVRFAECAHGIGSKT